MGSSELFGVIHQHKNPGNLLCFSHLTQLWEWFLVDTHIQSLKMKNLIILPETG